MMRSLLFPPQPPSPRATPPPPQVLCRAHQDTHTHTAHITHTHMLGSNQVTHSHTYSHTHNQPAVEQAQTFLPESAPLHVRPRAPPPQTPPPISVPAAPPWPALPHPPPHPPPPSSFSPLPRLVVPLLYFRPKKLSPSSSLQLLLPLVAVPAGGARVVVVVVLRGRQRQWCGVGKAGPAQRRRPSGPPAEPPSCPT
jgi:hypothetical protein